MLRLLLIMQSLKKIMEGDGFEEVYNSTVNGILERYCKKLSIPVISVHGLRHTHASILLYAGVSIGSVADEEPFYKIVTVMSIVIMLE